MTIGTFLIALGCVTLLISKDKDYKESISYNNSFGVRCPYTDYEIQEMDLIKWNTMDKAEQRRFWDSLTIEERDEFRMYKCIYNPWF